MRSWGLRAPTQALVSVNECVRTADDFARRAREVQVRGEADEACAASRTHRRP